MRLKQNNSGVTIAHIRTWALVCLTVGLAGYCVVLRGILGIREDTSLETITALFSKEQSRNFLVAALICQGVYSCAVPLFALLLSEGALYTRDFSKYLIRVLLVALVAEIPFDLATQGKWLDTTTLNPAFGTAFALVMLMFFRRYSDASTGSVILRVFITVAVVLWTLLLNVEEGPAIILFTSVIWNFRGKPIVRLIFGVLVAAFCWWYFGLFYYAASPLAMVLVHFYNGEKGTDFKLGRVVAYPAILVALTVACAIAF